MRVLNKKEMKGVRIIRDETTNKRFVQIDIDILDDNQEEIEEMLDVIVAENRKGDETISWEEVKAELKAEGRL